MGAAAVPRASAHGLPGVGAAGLRNAARRLRVLRPQGRLLHWSVDLLLPLHARSRRTARLRFMVARADRVSEGDGLESALRDPRPWLRQRSADGALLSALRWVAVLPPAG